MNNDDTFKIVQMAFKSKHYFKCSSFYLICVVSGIYVGGIETVLEKKAGKIDKIHREIWTIVSLHVQSIYYWHAVFLAIYCNSKMFLSSPRTWNYLKIGQTDTALHQ